MIYKEFQGKKLSALGLGAMRLPTIDGDDGRIDEAATAEMVAYAMEQGINYYDTAWGYHKGNSELVLGKILSQYPRESYCLASKFPGYDVSNMSKVEEIFERQLEKCGVDYFDFYLFHNVCEANIDHYLAPKYGIYDYLLKQKENGRIKHLGFSTHGSCATIRRFLDAYGAAMEFCQLQINYLDWEFQDGWEKTQIMKLRGIPVWVMEPLRGGSLATISREYEERLQELRPEETVPGWAFRFLQSIPEVTVTLSGMSNFEQLQQNIRTYSEDRPLNGKEMDVLLGIAEDMTKKVVLPCTSCRYCISHCPKELDIPMLLKLYNEDVFTGGGFLAPFALKVVPADKQPGACIGCRSCEQVCPQQIKISEAMTDFVARLAK